MHKLHKWLSEHSIVTTMIAIFLLAVSGSLLYSALTKKSSPKPPVSSFSALEKRLPTKKITKLVWDPNKSVVRVYEKNIPSYDIAIPGLASSEGLTRLLVEARRNDIPSAAKPVVADQTSIFRRILSLVPLLLLIGIGVFFMQQSGIGPWGRKRPQAAPTNVTFDDVAGCGEAVEEMSDVRSFLADPSKYERLGAKVPKGVLLYGPPGTGKTLLAKAVASEAGIPFFAASGSEFVEMFAGLGARRVRQLFEAAKEAAPSIIFIDEIDAVGAHRSGGGTGGEREADQTLLQLLKEMDGFDASKDHVIIMAATNRLDVLDSALLRPGRFDRHISIDPPDKRGRLEILKVHSASKRLAADVDLEDMAKSSATMSGADLALWLNEAALLAARHDHDAINHDDVEEAYYRIVAGAKKQHRALSAEEREIIAVHESGHALVGERLSSAEKVHKISIIPRGQSGGQTIRISEEDVFLHSRKQLENTLAMLMAGRAAEEALFGEITSGAGTDLEQATSLAKQMIDRLGMGKGLRVLDGPFSEELARDRDAQVEGLLEKAYGRALNIIDEEVDLIKALRDKLLDEETLNREQFLTIIN
jgi:cell division protease FtsH